MPPHTKSLMPEFVVCDKDLTDLNTLALSARAKFFVRIDSLDKLDQLRRWPEFSRLKKAIIGAGSNLILTDYFDGILIQPAFTGRRLAAQDEQAFYLHVAAGENWHQFVEWSLRKNLPGLENLIAIPGSVGAAPIQNIGAYGAQVSEFIDKVETVDIPSGKIRIFQADECAFAYRDSLFKRNGSHLDGRMMITSLTFRLPKNWQANTNYPGIAQKLAEAKLNPEEADAKAIAQAIQRIRQEKLPDPRQLANAGSFFHNPIVDAVTFHALQQKYPTLPFYRQPNNQYKLAAAWLIEQAHWKGRRQNCVGMDTRQALILVNYGGAKRHDVLQLAKTVNQAVTDKFGISLTIEPVIFD